MKSMILENSPVSTTFNSSSCDVNVRKGSEKPSELLNGPPVYLFFFQKGFFKTFIWSLPSDFASQVENISYLALPEDRYDSSAS